MGRPSIIEPEPILLPDSELLAKLFRALGDATRLRIIKMLLDGPRYQKEIVGEVGLSQGRVSQHLACLTWCGFVEGERDGRLVRYGVTSPRVVALVDLAEAFLDSNQAEIAACRRVDAASA